LLPDPLLAANNLLLLYALHRWLPAHSNLALSTIDQFSKPACQSTRTRAFSFFGLFL